MGYLKWLGHAAFEIMLDEKIIYIDPWITNPKSPIKLEDIKKADFIFVTHEHGDHLGESIEIAKKTGATFVSIYEIANIAQERGVKNAVGANMGGKINLGGLTAYIVPAFHSGLPTGIVIKGKETTIYHAGDTAVFGDMALIRELYAPKIALLPIGGHFTMGPAEAAKAVELIRPEIAIPMHYGTFPVISIDPNEFKRLVSEKALPTNIVILNPGETYEF